MRVCILLLTVIGAALPSAAQYSATLVADINPDGESDPSDFTVYNGRLFFSAWHADSGNELWAYDGATDQVALVADIVPGVGSSFPVDLEVYDGRLFFRAATPEFGAELWVYDDATGEVTLAADINTDVEEPDGTPSSSQPFQLTVYDDRLFFNADDGIRGRELWVYDAATGEATLAADINEGPEESYPRDLVAYDGRLFFAATTEPTGRELWAYDAGVGEATLVADVWPGSGFGLSEFSNHPTVYDGRLFFAASEEFNRRALWAYDAVTDEAEIALNLSPAFLTPYDGRLFFHGSRSGLPIGSELWAYDASTDEGVLAADIHPHDSSAPFYLTPFDDRLFFVADDGVSGREPWYYDALTGSAALAVDLRPGPASSFTRGFAEYDGRLFFGTSGDLGGGKELWALAPSPVSNEPSASAYPVVLHAPHPNPTQSSAHIAFDLGEAGTARVLVHDVLGRRVALLHDGPISAGEHRFSFDASALPAGTYFVRVAGMAAFATTSLTVVR